MIAWGRMIADGLMYGGLNDETPLMRMFRIEYGNEFRLLKKLGCEITDETIKQYLNRQ